MKTILGKLVCLLIAFIVMEMAVCAAETGNMDTLAKKNSVLQVNSDVGLREQPDEGSAITSTLPAGTPVVVREDGQAGWCRVSYREKEGYVQTSVLGIVGSPIIQDTHNALNIQENANTADNAVAQIPENIENNKLENKTEIQTENKLESEPDAKTENESESKTENEQESELENKTENEPESTLKDEPESKLENKSENQAFGNLNALDSEFASVKEEGIRAYQEAEKVNARFLSGILWKIVIAVLVVAIFAVGIISKLHGNKGIPSILVIPDTYNAGTHCATLAERLGGQIIPDTYKIIQNIRENLKAADNGVTQNAENEPEIKEENKLEGAPEIKVEHKLEIEPEIKVEHKLEIEPEIKVEHKLEIEPEIREENKLEIEPEIKAENKLEIEPEIREENKLEIEPEIKAENKLEIEPEIKAENRLEIEPEIKEENEPENKVPENIHMFDSEPANMRPSSGNVWKNVVAASLIAIAAVGITSILRGNKGKNGKR